MASDEELIAKAALLGYVLRVEGGVGVPAWEWTTLPSDRNYESWDWHDTAQEAFDDLLDFIHHRGQYSIVARGGGVRWHKDQ